MPEVYLNELSCRGSVAKAHSEDSVCKFVECLKELKKRSVECIYTHLWFDQIKVTGDETLKDLISTDEHRKAGIPELVYGFFNVNSPSDLKSIVEEYNVISSRIKGEDTIGLAASSEWVKNACALSIFKAGWDAPFYIIDITGLNKDGDETTDKSSARNISLKDHFDAHSSYLPLPPEKKYRIGKELERELGTLFPNLIFRDAARKFVKNCTSGDMVEQIYIKLKELQGVAQSIGSDTLKPELFNTKTTPDSVTRNNMLNLNFMFEDGITRNCEWHLRFTPGAGRIHISRDDAPENVIYVGYIGDKIV